MKNLDAEVFKNRNKLYFFAVAKLENAAAIMFGDSNLEPPHFVLIPGTAILYKCTIYLLDCQDGSLSE